MSTEFLHFNAKTLNEGLHILTRYADRRPKVIGGGTDLLRIFAQRCLPELPSMWVNLKTIPGLEYIIEENEVLRLGALTRLSDITQSDVVKTKYPLLAEAVATVGTPQIRNMATIAGSICQGLNCWYYRAYKNAYWCLYKRGKDCPAKERDNRWMFSIFGDAEGCYGTCQSDTSIALYALSARVKTTKRTIPIEEFFTTSAPGNVLESDEIITEIEVPSISADAKMKYLKLSVRKSIDPPLVSVACLLNVKDAKIVLGGVYLTPYRAKYAEDVIRGKEIDERLAEKAGEDAVIGAVPLSMNAWKVQVTRVLVKRALLALHSLSTPSFSIEFIDVDDRESLDSMATRGCS